MNGTKFVAETNDDLPFVFLINGRQDGSIPWQNNPPFYRALSEARQGFAVYYVDQGETVHAANLVYLWGERPPKVFPASTPRELFTGLMNKASIWPGDALKLDGDKVVEATFFGAEFNDKYVTIISSVPNVTELCKDLRVLILEATRIKPAGVERLKELFPQAELRVQSQN